MLESNTIKKSQLNVRDAEHHFFELYKVVEERENFLGNDAKIVQYGAVLRFFMKFLQQKDFHSAKVFDVLYWVYIKIGDIYYEEALQNQDNSKYFLAAEYYNQALSFADSTEKSVRVLVVLKDIYYYLDDEDAFLKVEESWVEKHNEQEKFGVYLLLAQNTDVSLVKIKFLEKALNLVMSQNEGFYTKYQNTLSICSKLATLYELVGDREKTRYINELYDNTLKLLN